MQWPSNTVRFSCALLAWGFAVSTYAGEESSTTRFSAEVGFGAEYDSNVSIDELDASINQSDYALSVDAELEVEQQLSATTDLTLTYDFSQNNYDRFSNLDRQTHRVGADINSGLGPVNTGLSLYYINARLDNEAFLEYYRASPYVSGFLAKK